MGSTKRALFDREPTLWLAVIYGLITVLGTLGIAHFSGQQASLVNAAIAAIIGAINAWAVRPISPVAYTYALAAIVQLASAYSLTLPDETLATINALIIPAIALISRGQVTPAPTAISRPSTELEKARES